MSGGSSIVEIQAAYEGELQGYQIFYIPCVFSAVSVDLVLAVQDGAIAGLSTGPYTGDREEEPPTESGDFDSRELALPVPMLGGDLPGTLTIPRGDGPSLP